MKKVCVLLFVCLLVMSLFGCAKRENNSNKVVDDLDVAAMHFEQPRGFTQVERVCNMNADGSLIEKDINFYYGDDRSISYFVMKDNQLNDLVSSIKASILKKEGKTFYIYTSGPALVALTQVENDTYGINYNMGTFDQELLEKIINAITFTKKEETKSDNINFGDMTCTYVFENVYSYATRRMEDIQGNLLECSNIWRFGENDENQEYRFQVSIIKNTSLENELDSQREYEDKEINGITYKVQLNSNDESPYLYITQHGNDVYKIANLGRYNGWSADRSNESAIAFEEFLNSISF